jgi:hypothetical protein
MGYYINTTSKGDVLPARNKAQALIEDGATEVDGSKFEDNLICVVENGPFDAAAFAYSEDEYEEFKFVEDVRPKRWLTHPDAKKLAGYNK